MKKITLLILLIISSFVTAQELVVNGNFESGVSPWYGNAANVVTENNNSYNSANVTAPANPWDVNLSQKGINMTSGKTYQLKFDAWSDQNRVLIVGIGLSASPWTNTTQTVNLTNTSQNFTVNLTANFSDADSRVLFDMGNAVGFVGIDNVSLMEVAGPTITAPTVAAPTPPARDAGDVLSVFSDAYTNLATNFDAGWCGANAIEEVMIAGNNTVLYKDKDCQGIVLNNGVDASAFNKLHIDVFIANEVDLVGKVFNLKFVGTPTSNFKEYNFNTGTNPALTKGSWISIDIDIDIANIGAWKEFGITSNIKSSGLWYDNFYIYKGSNGGGGNTPGAPTVAAPAAPTFNNASDYSSIYSSLGNISGIVFNTFVGATEQTVTVGGDPMKMLDVPTAGGGMNIIWGPPSDFAAAGITHFYFNYYTEEVGVGKVFNINIQGGGANWIRTIALPAAKTANNTWQTVNLAIADLNNQGNGSTNAISQVQITGAGPSNPIGKIFIDNVIFYKSGTASVDNNELLGFSMYPNPTTNRLNISAKETIKSAEVYSILGKKVMSVDVNSNSTSIDVSNLTNGVYLIKYNVNDKVGTAKFVKQ